MRPKEDDNVGPFPKRIFPTSVFPRRIFPWMGGNDEEKDSTHEAPDSLCRRDTGEDDKK